MTQYVIKIIAMADGTATPAAGHFILDFDPDAHDGRGELKTTRNARNAKKFSHLGAATDFWQLQSRLEPDRLDGKPNRPLTAFSVEMVMVTP